MKLLCVVFSLCFVLSNASLLELSQTLWKQLLDGGIDKIGQLDPLRVPVIKVDQSEGNTTYRITLRDVEIGGLNASTLESVHVARGKLKSNFSELEAGYVTYTDLKDLDTIRYRFHTMVKDDKNVNEEFSQRQGNTGNSRFAGRINDESRRRNYADFRGENFDGADDGQRFSVNIMESTRDIAPGVHIIYAQKIIEDNEQLTKNEKDEVECLGDCKRLQNPRGRYQQQQGQYNQQRNYNSQYQQYQQYTEDKKYDSQSQQYQQNSEEKKYEFQPQQYSQQPNYNIRGQNQEFNQPQYYRSQSERYNQQKNVDSREQNQQFNQQRNSNPQPQQYTQQQRFNQQRPFIKQENINERQFPSQRSNSDEYKDSPSRNYQYRKQFSVQIENQNPKIRDPSAGSREDAAIFGAHMHSSDSIGVNIRRNQETSAPVYRDSAFSNYNRPQGRFDTQYSNQNSEMYSERVPSSKEYSRNSESITGTVHDRKDGMAMKFVQNSQRPQNSEFSTRRQQQPQPGFIDIVYADEKTTKGSNRFENYKVDPDNLDVKVYGLKELMKDLRDSGRYIVHNFTKGEALTKRNDLARVAAETKRIKDLIRYARNHQEEQGYFEEGMELIYHYGDDDNQTKVESPRKKRAHDAANKEEDDVMHIILRVHVPVLHVKANYALTGKVGSQIVRGSGLFTGNFTDLIGDFMVELKKAEGESMVVRAARAKLVAKDRNVSLEGMDRKGPVDVILVHGLMAAEAVAAMIVDDLATKALSEKVADASVYKMYKSLPKQTN